MAWLLKDQASADSKQEDDPGSHLLNDVFQFQQQLTFLGESLHLLNSVICNSWAKLKRLEDQGFVENLPPIILNTPEAPPESSINVSANNSVSRQLESQLRVMRELSGQFGKQQESTQRLADALHELTRVAPNKVA